MAKTRKTVIEQNITFFSVAPACAGSSPGLASAHSSCPAGSLQSRRSRSSLRVCSGK